MSNQHKCDVRCVYYQSIHPAVCQYKSGQVHYLPYRLPYPYTYSSEQTNSLPPNQPTVETNVTVADVRVITLLEELIVINKRTLEELKEIRFNSNKL